MAASPESLSLNHTARSLTEYLRGAAGCVYQSVWHLDIGERAPANAIGLYIHESPSIDMGNGRTYYWLFLIDHGDEHFEPRLSVIEKVLRAHPCIHSLTRETAPDDMLKEMLCAQVLLQDQ